MITDAKFVHINLVTHDWKELAKFYQNVFGAVPVPPERDLAGDWLDTATGLLNAHIRGVHLRLPGLGAIGPTLEIFQYDPPQEKSKAMLNQCGYAHLAFSVNDVDAALVEVLAAGGEKISDPLTIPVTGAGTITFVYTRDPHGNLIELQSWT